MAKKSKSTTGARKTSKKKPANASQAASTRKTKATSRKKSTAKRASTRSQNKTPKSIDGILKQFEQERVAKQTQLVSVKKKISQLSDKVRQYEKEIAELQRTQIDTELAIETLDGRRDQEVGKLLIGMGVNLDQAAAAISKAGQKKVEKPTPLFDAAEKQNAGAKTPPKKRTRSKAASSSNAKTTTDKTETSAETNNAAGVVSGS